VRQLVALSGTSEGEPALASSHGATTDAIGLKRPRSPAVVPGARLIERRSTQTIALDDLDLAAVRYIREVAPRRPLSIAEVAEHAAVSARTLARRCRQHFGHPVGEETARTRERRMKSLLLGTPLPVMQIAAQMGLPSVGELCRFCRNRTGRSPSRWRRGDRP
jgi:AraC-like DNA-binding protein